MLTPLLIAALLAGAGKAEKIQTADKVTLAASWFAPAKRQAADAPAAIVIPMYMNRRQSYDAFAQAAASKGIGCLSVDPRGHGESDNPYSAPPTQWGGREWTGVLEDIKAAKAHLVAKGVDPKRIVLIGASIGASLALEYMVKDAELAGVGFLSISTDLTGKTATEDLARIAKRPVFVAYAKNDPSAAARGEAFAKAATDAGTGTVRVYKQAGHGTEMFGREDTKGDLTVSLITWIAAITAPAKKPAKGKAKKAAIRR